MTILCAIPIQIPVNRTRVTVRCLATGGPLHTAALRLAEYWGESPEEIAEVLGLPIPRVQQLLADLQQGGELVERDFVLWVDHARERVLPYSALSGAAVKRDEHGPVTLIADQPTRVMLQNMGLNAGLSWDLGLEGYVEVQKVHDVVADIRDRSLPHLLRLPDTQLVIAATHTGAREPTQPAFEFSLAQYGVIDPQLTRWARRDYLEDLDALVKQADLSPSPLPPEQPTDEGRWDPLQPHPGVLRERVREAAETAEDRLVLSAPDLRFLPPWLNDTIEQAAERDIQIVLCPSQANLAPRQTRFEFTTTPAPRQPQALTLLADDARAIMHSDPDACLDRHAMPVRQHLQVSRHESAIAWLREKLHIERLRARRPRDRLRPEKIASMLRQALGELQDELPAKLRASIQPEDERFAIEHLDRHPGREQPTRAARRATAGIAWERILATRVAALAATHDTLEVLAERWLPPKARIDLDLIVADDTKGLTWILDAKNSNPTDDQLAKMRDQIRLLKRAPELTGGRPVIGVIVHRARQLDTPIQATEHRDILRCTLQRLPDLLLAKHLPGERPRQPTSPKAD
jgi:hypothetical protein